MLILNGRTEIERGLTLPLAANLHDLIAARLRLLTGGEHDLGDATAIAIFEPGDTDADLQAGIGIRLLTNILDGTSYPSPDYTPLVDYLHLAGDHIYEAIVTVGNSGYGVHVLIPAVDGVAPDLLAWCRQYSP